MEKGRKIKVIAIIALVVAVIGMSLGFAAFSNILTISSSATVIPDPESFSIILSGSATDPYNNVIVPTTFNGATADDATISNGSNVSVLSHFEVNFTEPGQKVIFPCYMHNVGSYVGYVKEVEFLTVEGSDLKKTCKVVDTENTTESLVAAACQDIKIYLQLSMPKYSSDYQNFYNDVSFGWGNDLGVGEYCIANVVIEYLADGARADGAFIVEFGNISAMFSSAN